MLPSLYTQPTYITATMLALPYLARLYYCDNHNGKGKAQDYEAHLSTWRTFP